MTVGQCKSKFTHADRKQTIDLYRKVLPFLYLLMISGMLFNLYLRPSQWAIPQKISFSTFLKITEGLLVQR
jgi:hypothetical protein